MKTLKILRKCFIGICYTFFIFQLGMLVALAVNNVKPSTTDNIISLVACIICITSSITSTIISCFITEKKKDKEEISHE